MISNYEVVKRILFHKIKELIDPLQLNIFMSDMAKSFYYAWMVEMKRLR